MTAHKKALLSEYFKNRLPRTGGGKFNIHRFSLCCFDGDAVLAFYKKKIAAEINSRALRADALETLACFYLTLTLLLGLGANALFGWWWADPVAACHGLLPNKGGKGSCGRGL
jgi:hypothetical protein